MPHLLKSFFRAGVAILTGVLLTTGGVSLVEAGSSASYHHCHTVYAFTNSQASGKCGYNCSNLGHGDSRISNTNPGTWRCECKN